MEYFKGFYILRTTNIIVLLYCVFICQFLTISFAFNLDTTWPIIHTGNVDSLFGFSVALHQEGQNHMILAGAPLAQTNQENVVKGGAVFRCPIESFAEPASGNCYEVPFDTTGHSKNAGGFLTGNKSHQWLGATLHSAGPDGPVMACAPSYVWYLLPEAYPGDESTSREPTGVCFIATNDFSNIKTFTPCKKSNPRYWYEDKLTHCQAGIGGAITYDQVMVGGPGSFYWQGQVFIQDTAFATPLLQTQEAPISFDDSYRGYSVAFGDMNSDGKNDYIVGIPRAPNMHGMVSVYDHKLRTMYNVTGQQLAEYFGQSIVATDLNGDGFQDLIVSAPMYTDRDQPIVRYDVGRVYVFYQYEGGVTPPRTLVGEVGGGRFGFAIAAVGDLDLDGFNDLAVGAPFAGDGAVYIFRGSRRGIITAPSQIVRPADIQSPMLKGFGNALSGNRDVDGNTYPDLLIGAFMSSSVALLRSRPVLQMNPQITFNVESIDLETKAFSLPDGSLVSGFQITTCLAYSGRGTTGELDFAATLQLDSTRLLSSRAFILLDGESIREVSGNFTLTRDVEKCQSYRAYVKNLIRDKISPVQFLFRYHLNKNASTVVCGELAPVLSQSASYQTQQLALLKNCRNELCQPDLALTAISDKDLLYVGRESELNLTIDVQNKYDEAFEARVYIITPVGVQFVRVESGVRDSPVICDDFTDALQGGSLICEIGNPFPAEHKLSFVLRFLVAYLDGKSSNLQFDFITNSTNPDYEDNYGDNMLTTRIPLKIFSNITFYGYSNPPQVIYEILKEGEIELEIMEEADIGPEIIHYYEVNNLGPSNIGVSGITIRWPMAVKGALDDYLLYITKVTITKGTCDTRGYENLLGIKLREDPKAINRTSEEELKVLKELSKTVSKRSADTTEVPPMPPEQLKQADCFTDDSDCYEFECIIDPLKGEYLNENALIIIKSRMWSATLRKDTPALDWYIQSNAVFKVYKLPYSVRGTLPAPIMANASVAALPFTFTTIVNAPFPIWAFILAALVGLAILALIIGILWRFGFFRRKKIGDKTSLSPQGEFD